MYHRQYQDNIGWEDEPSVATPINATNLNQMDQGISGIDAESKRCFDRLESAIEAIEGESVDIRHIRLAFSQLIQDSYSMELTVDVNFENLDEPAFLFCLWEGRPVPVWESGHNVTLNVNNKGTFNVYKNGTLLTTDNFSLSKESFYIVSLIYYNGAYRWNLYEINAGQLSGIVPIENGGTGNADGYIRTGLRDGYTAGTGSTAEGSDVNPAGNYSHAEGGLTGAIGNYSHAEGYASSATKEYAHAEGHSCTAGSASTTGIAAHAEGTQTYATGDNSHSEGLNSAAMGAQSHASGENVRAGYDNQTVIGKFNNNKSDTLFEVGNGASTNARSNALEVKENGNLVASGTITDGNGNVLSDVADKLRVFDITQSGSIQYINLSRNPPVTVSDNEIIILHFENYVSTSAGVWVINLGQVSYTVCDQDNAGFSDGINAGTYLPLAFDSSNSTFVVMKDIIVANPYGTASASLTTIKIGSTIYSVSGGGSGNILSKTRYQISYSYWSSSANSDGYYTYSLTLNPTIESSPNVFVAGSSDGGQPTSTHISMFACIDTCKVNGSTLTLYAKIKPTSSFYIWVEGINGTSSADIRGNVIKPNSVNPYVYSTSEVEIGIWFGKKLYRQCVYVSSLPNAGSTAVYYSSTGKNIIKCYGFAFGYYVFSMPNNNDVMWYEPGTGAVFITTTNDRSVLSCYIVLEYTKN